MPTEKLKILPLGGLGEIGMNCLCLESDEGMVLIDCGIQFPDSSYPGVDILTPDLTYVQDRLDKLLGIVITHGHDDHIGAIPFLAKDTELTVYCTPFPKGLLLHKLAEHSRLHEVTFREIKPREKFRIGPFTFDPIPVQHSIIESVAFAIETPIGTIVHTGDFKHDANEIGGQTIGFEAFEEVGDKGVLCLFSDSTNAERHGHTLSEADIAHSFEEIFDAQKGRILIALFASNIRRIERLMWLAKKRGKKVALAGRSMHTYTRLAHEQGKLNIPEDTLVLLENLGNYAEDSTVVLLTGSQAEPGAALVRISQGTHKDFQVRGTDTVILSSRFIPGNERNITAMIDHLYRMGADVIYEDIHEIHVSGHGYQDELLMMLKATRPKFFVPIHGEFRHLSKHAKLAEGAGVDSKNIVVIEDGQGIELTPDRVTRLEPLTLQKGIVVDGKYMAGTAALFTQRNNLSKTGVVFTVVVRDHKNLDLVATPQVSTYGLLLRRGEEMEETVRDAVDLIEDLYPDAARRPDLSELLRVELRRFFRHRVSHKPVVIPVVIDI